MVSLVLILGSCHKNQNYYNEPTLEEVITNYDIWYVDFNRTTGTSNVPMLSKAFTISFKNGRAFANNNLVGFGNTGNGYGIQIGTYDTYNGLLKVNHSLDGLYNFEVYVDTPQSIRLYNAMKNVTYFLEGHSANHFDYNQVFYDNIEYFLQEYYAWSKTYTSLEGEPNVFDEENYLAFTPENIKTFYSSKDATGTPIDDVIWDFTGSYEVFDVNGYDNLKIVKLFYNSDGNEEFELTVLNDGTIELYHVFSETTYRFSGQGFIQYKNSGKSSIKERERFKVTRRAMDRNPKAIKKRP